jgi:1,4-alpha-glucan branching enzyme
MGSEIGMFREWAFEEQIEWFLLDYDMHARLQLFNAELNKFYLENPALWDRDDSMDSFRWIDADNADQSICSYRRIARNGKELAILINFLPVAREDFLMAVPENGAYEEVFNTDDTRYGGEGRLNPGLLRTEPCMLRDYTQAVRITVPAHGAVILKLVRRAPKPRVSTKKCDRISKNSI